MITALLILLSFLAFIAAFIYALTTGDNLTPLIIAATATATAMIAAITKGSRWP